MEPGKKSSTGTAFRRNLPWLAIPLAFVLAAGLALAVDCPISHWWLNCFNDTSYPKFISRGLVLVRDFLTVFENFGNGLGVGIILFSIFVLDPARRWAFPRLLGCAYGAGLAANGLKLMLARTRPNDFKFLGDVWTTFGAWFPGSSAGCMGQGFPSAHTATAVGFAAGLVWLYPRGRWLFPLFAMLTGCQRIQTGAHFTSDVLAGAAVGSLAAIAFLKCGLLPGWMDNLESKMRGEE